MAPAGSDYPFQNALETREMQERVSREKFAFPYRSNSQFRVGGSYCISTEARDTMRIAMLRVRKLKMSQSILSWPRLKKNVCDFLFVLEVHLDKS